MISSPCKTCPKRHLPKDICMHGCDKIRGVQNLQLILKCPPYPSNNNSDYLSINHSLFSED
jgi:hypothetical protein